MSHLEALFKFLSPFHKPMSVRASLFRFFILFATIMSLVFLVFASVANAQEIMPLSQIKPGMRGYGLTVFKGAEPEKFDFEVRGLYFEGNRTFIIVLLSGGPRDIDGQEFIKTANIVRGMSGSPLYIQDKIIGALSEARIDQKTPQAKVTPIEKMISFRPLDLSSTFVNQKDWAALPKPQSPIHAGETYVVCEIWDENQYCPGYIGNVTYLDPAQPSLFYALGHSATVLGGAGRTGVPFWKGEMVTIIPSYSSSDMLVNKSGPMLGSIIFDSSFGQIGKLGVAPKFFTVKITLENGPGTDSQFNYNFAYTTGNPSNLADILSHRARLFDRILDVEEDVTIYTTGPQRTSYRGIMDRAVDMESGAKVPTSEAGFVLRNILTDQLRTLVEDIRVVLRGVPRRKVLKIKEVEAEFKSYSSEAYLTLLASNDMDWKTGVTLASKYFNKPLNIATGKEIAKKILSSGDSLNADAAALLNKVSDWDAAYLYYAPEENQVLVLGNGKDNNPKDLRPKNNGSTNDSPPLGRWQSAPRQSATEILAKIDPPNGYRLDGSLSFLIEYKAEEKNKKKKFIIF